MSMKSMRDVALAAASRGGKVHRNDVCKLYVAVNMGHELVEYAVRHLIRKSVGGYGGKARACSAARWLHGETVSDEELRAACFIFARRKIRELVYSCRKASGNGLATDGECFWVAKKNVTCKPPALARGGAA
jgi:hypothetical protein